MSIEVKDGKVSVAIDGAYSESELLDLINQLAQARMSIANDPLEPVDGQHYHGVQEPRLWTKWGPDTNEQFMLMTRFPDLGWRLAILSPATASALGVFIAQYMNYLATKSAADPTTPNRTAATPTGGSGGTVVH